MLKTSELTGAQLDYWVARAEGISAEQLTIRRVQRSTRFICVRAGFRINPSDTVVLSFSTQWAFGGPLIDKHRLVVDWMNSGKAVSVPYHGMEEEFGDTPLQAICRAVVRAAFGDGVEEVAVCE